jgi:hypothetical protein
VTRTSTKTLIAALIAAGAVAVGASTILPANAATPPPTTVTSTGPDQATATSTAYAECEAKGYNADTVQKVMPNPDGTFTVTLYCYNV